MTRNEYLRRYIDYGWTIVPVMKGTKRPAVDWKKYQTVKPTKEELHQWFEDPDVGVGLITGECSGVIVVDEDSYKKDGNTVPLNTPLVCLTGGGGRHLYFKWVDSLHNTVNRKLSVDVRGDGGFVVLPPTLHPSGTTYKWENELPPTLEGLPTLEEESFLQELYRRNENPKGEYTPLKVDDYMNVGEGGRNDGLYRMACSLFNKHSPEDAFKLLMAVNETYDPKLDEYEVKVIAKSAYNWVNNNPSDDFKKKLREQKEGTQEREKLEILTYAEAKAKYEDLMKRYGNGITTGYNILDTYFKFVPQQLYMLSAPTHAGKTTLALNICGRAARAGHKVLYASLEQGVFIMSRLKTMFGDEKGLENLSIIAPDFMPNPDDFLKLLEGDNKPGILVVDHLHYFDRSGKSAAEEMDKLVVKMQIVAKKLEIPVVVIAHVRKLNYQKPKPDHEGVVVEPPLTMDDLKDSSSLAQIPSVVVMMQRKRNAEEEIRAGSPIYSNEGTLYIHKNRIHGITGSEVFRLHDNGEIVFARDFNDRIAAEALPTPEVTEETEQEDILGNLGL